MCVYVCVCSYSVHSISLNRSLPLYIIPRLAKKTPPIHPPTLRVLQSRSMQRVALPFPMPTFFLLHLSNSLPNRLLSVFQYRLHLLLVSEANQQRQNAQLIRAESTFLPSEVLDIVLHYCVSLQPASLQTQSDSFLERNGGRKVQLLALVRPCVYISWAIFSRHFIPLLIDTGSGSVVFADSFFESSNSRSAKLSEITTLLTNALQRPFTVSNCEIPMQTETECGVCAIHQCLVWLALPSLHFDTFSRAECADLYERALGIEHPQLKTARPRQAKQGDHKGQKPQSKPDTKEIHRRNSASQQH